MDSAHLFDVLQRAVSAGVLSAHEAINATHEYTLQGNKPRPAMSAVWDQLTDVEKGFCLAVANDPEMTLAKLPFHPIHKVAWRLKDRSGSYAIALFKKLHAVEPNLADYDELASMLEDKIKSFDAKRQLEVEMVKRQHDIQRALSGVQPWAKTP